LSRAGVIVANIVADTVVDVLPDAAARLEPGGVFVGSGIVAGRVRGVLRAGRAAGLRPDAVLRDGDWRAVVFSARPSPARRSRRPRHR
jgi:ribosomal protein L11 methyltransferase